MDASRAHRLARALVPALIMTALVGVTAVPARAGTRESLEVTVKAAGKARKRSQGAAMTPITLRTVLRITDPTGAQPRRLRKLIVRFPAGGRANLRAFPTCNPSRIREDGSGCGRALIGRGTGRADARPLISSVPARILMFNGRPRGGDPTVIVYAIPKFAGPSGNVLVRGVVTRDPTGYLLTLDIPRLPTTGEFPDAAVTLSDVTTIDRTVRRGGRRIHLLEAPAMCDGTGFLVGGGQAGYEGGVTHDVLERLIFRGGRRCR
jgi:hypothetical protein